MAEPQTPHPSLYWHRSPPRGRPLEGTATASGAGCTNPTELTIAGCVGVASSGWIIIV